MPCPLCSSVSHQKIHEVEKPWRRSFFLCPTCSLIFVPSQYFLTLTEERRRYEEHNNDPTDPKYREFLNQVFTPLKARLRPTAIGLDYGCGPGPALAQMFGEAGFTVKNYDPLFAPDANLLNTQYDFITCTETAEHFHQPLSEFLSLYQMLKPGGMLCLLTQFWDEKTRFDSWYYQRDPTHVIFFHALTVQWLESRFDWRAHWESKNVVTFVKPFA